MSWPRPLCAPTPREFYFCPPSVMKRPNWHCVFIIAQFMTVARHRGPKRASNLQLSGYKTCALTTWPKGYPLGQGAWSIGVQWQDQLTTTRCSVCFLKTQVVVSMCFPANPAWISVWMWIISTIAFGMAKHLTIFLYGNELCNKASSHVNWLSKLRHAFLTLVS